MKNIIVCLLLIVSLCSFTKKKKKPEAAFKKGYVTAVAGTGYPNVFRYYRGKSLPALVAGADYQASKRWSFGLQYSFHYSKSGVRTRRVYTNSGGTYIPTDSFRYKQRVIYHTFMATADFCYLNRGRVCLNSGIGLGYIPDPMVSTQFLDNKGNPADVNDANHLKLAFRLRLINAKVKITENFGVYGGLSYGVDGFILVGAHYTFTGRE